MLRDPKVHPASLTAAQARDVFAASPKTHMILLTRGPVLLGTLIRDDLAGPVPLAALAVELGSVTGRCVPPGASLLATYEAMCERSVRRLAVTDTSGHLQGLLCLKRSGRGFCDDVSVAAMRRARQ